MSDDTKIYLQVFYCSPMAWWSTAPSIARCPEHQTPNPTPKTLNPHPCNQVQLDVEALLAEVKEVTRAGGGGSP